MTKSYRLKYWLLFTFSLLCNLGPLCFFTVQAFIQSDLTHEKVALCMTVFVVLIMTVISLVNKVALRSRLWIILIGIYICLDHVLTPLVVIACCQIVDEVLIAPLKHSIKEKLVINKQIDRRI